MRHFLDAILLGLFFFIPPLLHAQPAERAVNTTESTLSYTGHHTLHSWTGVSSSVGGTLFVDPASPAESRIAIVVPVESFDSENSKRDSNMLDLVDADQFPEVRFTSDEIVVESWQETDTGYQGNWKVSGILSFHGLDYRIEIPAAVTINGSTFEAQSSFPVSLSQFEVHRPKLLLIRISDTIDLSGVIRADIGNETQANRPD